MKTISAEQAVQQFDEYSKLAHNGEQILVVREGKPWVLLTPPANPPTDAIVTSSAKEWPDFTSRLKPHYTSPVSGPTATEILSEDKSDRF